jgi:predicted nucleic acid-binding protein
MATSVGYLLDTNVVLALIRANTLGKNDAWIAATAMVTRATLLTTDMDFDHLHGKYLDRIWIDPNTKSP